MGKRSSYGYQKSGYFHTCSGAARFTKAGDKLGYSQSTVSFQIRQLENELGVPLFERINRTVTLTEHGIRLLRSAYKINELLESFQKETKAETKVHGRVRLAIADSLSSEVIRRIFPELHRKYPDITLECISAGTQEMFRLLNQNEADIVYTLVDPRIKSAGKECYE